MRSTKQRIEEMAAKTADAYSHDAYTPAAWRGIIRALEANGAKAAEIEWILRSKHMRWAADSANRSAHVTAADFTNYVLTHSVGGKYGWERTGFYGLIAEAIKATTPKAAATTGADLAEFAQGEDIADLIDAARALVNGNRNTALGMATRALASIDARAKEGR